MPWRRRLGHLLRWAAGRPAPRLVAVLAVLLLAGIVARSGAGLIEIAGASCGVGESGAEADWVLADVPFPGNAEVTRWQEQWDVWSVHPSLGVVVRLPPSAAQVLVRDHGGRVLAAQQSATPRWFSCYVSYAEAVTELNRLASTYSAVAEVIEVGPTWLTMNRREGDRYLWALRLTNRSLPGPKPRFLLVALHHAREAVTPPLALAVAERLAESYGTDPTLTWLLDTAEVWVIPVANPDGLVQCEQLQDWRKNDNESACGGQPARQGHGPGVDMNRNYGFAWGGAGASSHPCDEVYRGSDPFSEPETQALRDLMRDEMFDLVISLHSYSEVVLYPWSYTDQVAPDDAGLAALAHVLAAYSGYRPIRSHQLYFSSGETCDWVYGELGRPCLTIEVGSAADGYFWPTCTVMARQIAANLDALVHAARLSPDPYALARGPLAGPVTVEDGPEGSSVRAELDDSRTGAEAVVAAEYWFGQPGEPGAGTAMEVRQTGPARALGLASIPSASIPPGRTWLLVRGQDQAGNWGPIGAAWIEGAPRTLTPTATYPPTDLPPGAPTPTPTPTAPPTLTPTSTPGPTATPSAMPTASPGTAGRTFLPLVLLR